MMTGAGTFSLVFLPFGATSRDLGSEYRDVFWSDDIDRRFFRSLAMGTHPMPKYLEQLCLRPDHILERFLRIARHGAYFRRPRGGHLHIAGATLRATAPLWHVLLSPKALAVFSCSMETEVAAVMSAAFAGTADDATLIVNLCRRCSDSYRRAFWPSTRPIYF